MLVTPTAVVNRPADRLNSRAPRPLDLNDVIRGVIPLILTEVRYH